ncbi:unnamed protein product, partial [Symbiodinium necroappetens]
MINLDESAPRCVCAVLTDRQLLGILSSSSMTVLMEPRRFKIGFCKGSRHVCAMLGRLSARLENIPIVRKRFRKGNPWIREPVSTGGNALQTTRALELNYNILRVVLLWMDTPKISVKRLEPEVIHLFKKMGHIPEDRKQHWIDAWSIRTMLSRQDWADQLRTDRLDEPEDPNEYEEEDDTPPRRGGSSSGGKEEDPPRGEEAAAMIDEQEEDPEEGEEWEEGEEEEEKEDDPIADEPSESYHTQHKRDQLKAVQAEIAALQEKLAPLLSIICVFACPECCSKPIYIYK